MTARVISVDSDDPDPAALAPAAEALRGGGLVAFPTETVYGLGANALDAVAVGRVFAAKERPADNPLIVHVGDPAQLAEVASAVPGLGERLVARWWPGPLTVVVDAAKAVPRITTGGLSTVAVRMPDHPVALALIQAAGIPVAAPSANRSGRPSPTTAAHVRADLEAVVDVIVDGGPCPVGVESTVVDVRGAEPMVLREGAVTREDLGLKAAVAPLDSDLAASPGTRHRHYAPACPVELVPAGEGPRRAAALTANGRRAGVISTRAAERPAVTLATFDDAAELARLLYDALRRGEAAGVDVIVVEAVAETGIGRAVMDRLRRAAAG